MNRSKGSAVFVAAGVALQALGVGIAYLGFLAVLAEPSPADGSLTAMGWGAAISIFGCVLLVLGLFRAFNSIDTLAGAARYAPRSPARRPGVEAAPPRVTDFG